MTEQSQQIALYQGVNVEKFKVKKKHLTGEIADFPKRVVQAMVDEQVRQGNPADPSVFSALCTIAKSQGGFNWKESLLGWSFWTEIILGKKFHLIPKKQSIAPEMAGGQNSEKPSVEPHAIIQHMLDKGMVVWACVSDKSYDDARERIGYYAQRATKYNADKHYPVQTLYAGWKYAVPVDIATMTEITEVPK